MGITCITSSKRRCTRGWMLFELSTAAESACIKRSCNTDDSPRPRQAKAASCSVKRHTVNAAVSHTGPHSWVRHCDCSNQQQQHTPGVAATACQQLKPSARVVQHTCAVLQHTCKGACMHALTASTANKGRSSLRHRQTDSRAAGRPSSSQQGSDFSPMQKTRG